MVPRPRPLPPRARPPLLNNCLAPTLTGVGRGRIGIRGRGLIEGSAYCLPPATFRVKTESQFKNLWAFIFFTTTGKYAP